MKIGVSLLRAKPSYWPEIVTAAEELGYESIWLSDHLVIPVDMRGSYPGAASTVDVETVVKEGPNQAWPMFDCPTMLASLAAGTSRLRFGTYVYLLGIRHPFVTARSWATLDMVTNGRVELGVGAGWLRSEWDAAGENWKRRGTQLDESIDVCRRLWQEPTIAHDGEIWSFEEIVFDPKPIQQPGIPILVGGENERSMRRAAERGDGWIAMEHTPESIRPKLDQLHRLLEENGRDPATFPITAAGAAKSLDDIAEWEALGVDRLILTPWSRASTAREEMSQLAQALELFAQN